MGRKLYRLDHGTVAGVCGGLGEFFSVDPTFIRLIFAISAVVGVGSGLLIYIIAALVLPKKSSVNWD